MALRLNNLRIEAAEPQKLAQFWIRALDWHLVHGTADAVLIAPSTVRPLPRECQAVLFYRSDSPKTERNRLLFDLAPTNREQEIERLEQLGAKRLDVDLGDARWIAMCDPEGNEFCVLHTPGQLPRKHGPA